MRPALLAIAAGLTFAVAIAATAQPAAAPATAAAAQPAAAPAIVAGQAEPSAVVAEVRRVIAERYVLPERRGALDAVLEQGLRSGRYAVAEPSALAERINADLERVGRDRHLNFAYNPQFAAQLASAPAGPGGPPLAAFLRQARASNHGISEMRVLPGNIRYIAYDGFVWTGPDSAAAIDTAMRFLNQGDVAIIDLRRNGGGSPQAVQRMISHFLPAGRPLVAFHMGGRPEPDRLSSLDALVADRMVGKPLYVLTSGGTASAAEEFTGHVAGFGIGELVGANTAGAGFRNQLVPIPGGFVLSVSVGRAVLASTGRDWEAVGIAPTIAAPVEKALETAQAHALRRLAASAPAEDRPRLEALADAADARLAPRAPALPLEAYAGRFGERVVSVADGRLRYGRGERPPTPLLPLGGNIFAFESDPALRLTFHVADASATAFTLGAAGAPSQGRYERTP